MRSSVRTQVSEQTTTQPASAGAASAAESLQENGAANSSTRPRYRALLEPVDASMSLWDEGRRERIAELDASIRRSENEGVEWGRDMRRRRRSEEQNGDATDSAGRLSHDVGSQSGETDSGDNVTSGTRSPDIVVTRTLAARLGLWDSRGWRPPRLRDLPRDGEGFFSGWTHVGQPDRFELVKSANRSSRSDGGELNDEELEWAVLCAEEAEARMAVMDFSVAADLLERVLGRCPGFTLAYYRLALCLLAARGRHSSAQTERLLQCAMHLEGEQNPHLKNAVDLVRKMLSNEEIPEAYWSEDYPKSLGDLRALESAADKL